MHGQTGATTINKLIVSGSGNEISNSLLLIITDKWVIMQFD